MVERIRQLLEDRQLTPTQFADAIGVARPIVSHVLSGRNKPSLEVVQKIIAAFPDLALPWLLSGVGPMRQSAATPAAAPVAVTLPVEDPKKVPERPATPPGPRRPAVAQPKPFRGAARPVTDALPGPGILSAEQAPTAEPAPLAAEPAAPTVHAPAAPPTPVADSPAADISLATAFAEPGKAIRRIVLFYQDGTFTDFCPES